MDLLFTCTHAGDDAERATLPFIAANAALAVGQTAAVVCTVEGVRIGVAGGAGIAHEGMPALAELYDRFVETGGEVWLCSACTTTRGITEERLAPGARIVGAAYIVEQITLGARSVSLS